MARRSPAAGPKVLAIVLAGGEGKRLMPLTADRAKPAVPFGGIYRLIDLALSNVVNSGYLQVVVLTQYKSHSLDAHVTKTWRMSTLLGNYVTTVPAIRQPISLAYQCGVIEVDDADPSKIAAFLEKPKDPKGLPDNPGEVLASMGNYVFTAAALEAAVIADHDNEASSNDMGGDIVPYFVGRGEAGVYDFKTNEVPGATDRDRGYWRDVGTIESYYDAHMDLISIH